MIFAISSTGMFLYDIKDTSNRNYRGNSISFHFFYKKLAYRDWYINYADIIIKE